MHRFITSTHMVPAHALHAATSACVITPTAAAYPPHDPHPEAHTRHVRTAYRVQCSAPEHRVQCSAPEHRVQCSASEHRVQCSASERIGCNAAHQSIGCNAAHQGIGCNAAHQSVSGAMQRTGVSGAMQRTRVLFETEVGATSYYSVAPHI